MKRKKRQKKSKKANDSDDIDEFLDATIAANHASQATSNLAGNYFYVKCIDCQKELFDKKQLRQHMEQVHKASKMFSDLT